MNCAPLNLAHFHERRSEKFLRKHRYDEAYKAVEASLLYLQDAYKTVRIDKSIEILNTQKWAYERRLRQIELQKAQYDRMKSREIVPIAETSVVMKPSSSESTVTAQSVSKSIDRTIESFDTKVAHMSDAEQVNVGKETCKNESSATAPMITNASESIANKKPDLTNLPQKHSGNSDTFDDLPSLTPLELPSFDIQLFTSSSAPSLASFTGLAEHLQK